VRCDVTERQPGDDDRSTPPEDLSQTPRDRLKDVEERLADQLDKNARLTDQLGACRAEKVCLSVCLFPYLLIKYILQQHAHTHIVNEPEQQG